MTASPLSACTRPTLYLLLAFSWIVTAWACGSHAVNNTETLTHNPLSRPLGSQINPTVLHFQIPQQRPLTWRNHSVFVFFSLLSPKKKHYTIETRRAEQRPTRFPQPDLPPSAAPLVCCRILPLQKKKKRDGYSTLRPVDTKTQSRPRNERLRSRGTSQTASDSFCLGPSSPFHKHTHTHSLCLPPSQLPRLLSAPHRRQKPSSDGHHCTSPPGGAPTTPDTAMPVQSWQDIRGGLLLGGQGVCTHRHGPVLCRQGDQQEAHVREGTHGTLLLVVCLLACWQGNPTRERERLIESAVFTNRSAMRSPSSKRSPWATRTSSPSSTTSRP